MRLETLAEAFPLPVKFESRRRKIQRLLILPHLTIAKISFPLVSYFLETYCPSTAVLYVAIDRTQWACTNLLMLSLIWDKRAIPRSLGAVTETGR